MGRRLWGHRSSSCMSRKATAPRIHVLTFYYSGRALDGFVLQRALLILNPLPALFGRLGIDVPPPPSGGLALSISSHELTPFQAIIWGMSITNALKQILWLVYISKEEVSHVY